MCDLRRPAAGGMMDLAYVCEWEKWSKSTHCPSVPLACAWSCRNLIAFTMDLRSDDQDLTRMIHILDTEHPWDLHSIPSEHHEAITCLEWDQSGSRLLSADADGQIKCWSMADHLANSWESSVGSLVEGDPIVALSWLHNGVKLALHVEKSLLRPHFLNTPDKSPGDRLTEICTKITDVDIDKVMINLKTEEFVL
ncbi:mediator complex subunit 16, partial [Homo sapiens]